MRMSVNLCFYTRAHCPRGACTRVPRASEQRVYMRAAKTDTGAEWHT